MDVTLEQIGKWEEGSFLYLDTRGEAAYGHGHIDGAACYRKGEEPPPSFSGKKIVAYCTYGEESRKIAEGLQKQGYEAYNLKGGFREWLRQKGTGFSRQELERYDRQMILPQLGTSGQKRLKQSKALIVGAGGLGAPAALYLAGAGIGEIGIVDADAVSLSNLQRQVIHDTDGVGMNKALSAKRRLERLNDQIKVRAYQEFFSPENAEEIVRTYDFVIDASDNFETKFLLNDVCVLQRKAFCHAGILGFQGQAFTYVPGRGPCYRCIFEEIPRGGDVPNCSQVGVIGALAGIVGSVQALEAVKYLAGIGELLTGKLYVLDGLTMQSRIVGIPKKNEACRVCGRAADIRSVSENAAEYRRQPCAL